MAACQSIQEMFRRGFVRPLGFSALSMRWMVLSLWQTARLIAAKMIQVCFEAEPDMIGRQAMITPVPQINNSTRPECSTNQAGISNIADIDQITRKLFFVSQAISTNMLQGEPATKPFKKSINRGLSGAFLLKMDRVSRASPALTLDKGAAL